MLVLSSKDVRFIGWDDDLDLRQQQLGVVKWELAGVPTCAERIAPGAWVVADSSSGESEAPKTAVWHLRVWLKASCTVV